MKIGLIFLAAFGYFVYMALSVGPVWGFYLYELVYFLNPNNRWWSSSIPGVGYSFLVVLTTLFSFLIYRNKMPINQIKDLPQFKWFVLVLLSFIAVTPFAVAPDMHNRFLMDVIKLYVIMYLAYAIITSEQKLDMALVCFVIGAAYIGYEAMSVGRNATGRVEGIGPVDAPAVNGTGAAIAPTIPILVYLFWRGNRIQKGISVVCGLLIVNGLILMNGRGAFLGAAVGFAYFFGTLLFSKYRFKNQTWMAVLIICGALGAGLRLVDDSYIERMSTIESTSSKDVDASGGRRINFWFATFDLMEDYPLGVGVYGYQVLSPIYLNDESFFDVRKIGKKIRAVHSMWFQGLSEIGWHGIAFFILLLFSLRKSLNKAKAKVSEEQNYHAYYRIVAVQAALLAFLTAGTFIDAFRAVILYWLLMFNCVAAKLALYPVEDKNREIPAKD